MPAASEARHGPRLSGAVLLAGLLIFALALTALTRAVRSQDDIVNTVELTAFASQGNDATIRFDLTEAEARADVLIIDDVGNPVRALALGEPLAAGPQEFSWDLATDDGGAAPLGSYQLRVVLDSQGRDIEPPGAIEIVVPDELTGE